MSNNMKLLAALLRVMSCVTKKEFFQAMFNYVIYETRRQVFKTSVTFSYEIFSGHLLK